MSLLYIALGALAGILAGLFGIGGYLAPISFPIALHAATSTSGAPCYWPRD